MQLALLLLLLTSRQMATGNDDSNSWWLSVAGQLAAIISPESQTQEDNGWLNSIKNRLVDVVDDVIDVNLYEASTTSWNGMKRVSKKFLAKPVDWNIIQNITSSLAEYDIDLNNIKNHLSSWTWSKFAEEYSITDDQSNEGTKFIDNLDKTINSFHSFQESKQADSKLPPECFMNAPQLIRYAGYPCSIYSTITKDGYKLTMHRIPFGPKETFKEKREAAMKQRRPRGSKLTGKPVVFLQHGILADSSTWCSSGSDRSLAFILVDEGFDVWMGNSRGNLYSRDHVHLNPDFDEEFWRFSWQEMSEHDLPAMVEAVLKITRQEKIYYIGHSQGTLTAFARLAENPKFNDKIHLMIGLGPVATLGHITSPIRSLTGLTDIVHFGISLMGGAEILPRTALSTWLTAKLHKITSEDQLAYHGSNLLLFLVGFNVYHYHRDRLPVMLAHTPSGTSLHNLVHMSQLIDSGKMQKWNYWEVDDNIEVYGQAAPTEYDLGKIKIPIALYVGADDKLADPTDARMLAAKLKTVFHFEILEDWDHLDFLWGERAPEKLYKNIIKTLHNFESKRRNKLTDEL